MIFCILEREESLMQKFWGLLRVQRLHPVLAGYFGPIATSFLQRSVKITIEIYHRPSAELIFLTDPENIEDRINDREAEVSWHSIFIKLRENIFDIIIFSYMSNLV